MIQSNYNLHPCTDYVYNPRSGSITCYWNHTLHPNDMITDEQTGGVVRQYLEEFRIRVHCWRVIFHWDINQRTFVFLERRHPSTAQPIERPSDRATHDDNEARLLPVLAQPLLVGRYLFTSTCNVSTVQSWKYRVLDLGQWFGVINNIPLIL